MVFLLVIFILLFITNRSRFLNIYWLGFILLYYVIYFLQNTFFAAEPNTKLYYFGVTLFIFAFVPFVLLAISIVTFFNSKQLMEKEGRRVRNLFISVLGLASLVILLMSASFYLFSSHSILSEFIFIYIVAIFMYFLWLFSSTAIYAVVYNAAPVSYEPNYIIVLGSGLIGDTVPPLLASRLDKAVKKYQQYGERPLLITSGGQGSDELVAEAVAMKKYIVETHQIEADRILVEDQSTTTYENLLFSKKIIEEQISNAKGIFVTNNFHVLRASIYAQKVGLKAIGRGSKTAFYYVPNAFMREFVGLLEMTKKRQILLVAGFTLFWGMLTFSYM